MFNPAAAQVGDETILLARVEDLSGISHLTVARSANGVDGWVVDPEPLLAPRTASRASMWGFEDRPRRLVAELDRWAITCTAYGPAGPAVPLATTRTSRPSSGTASSAARGQERRAAARSAIDGKWILFHRPTTAFGGPAGEIVLSRSDDLVSWSAPEPVMQPRDGAWWDSRRIGIGPPPIEPSTAGC